MSPSDRGFVPIRNASENCDDSVLQFEDLLERPSALASAVASPLAASTTRAVIRSRGPER